MSSKHVNFQNSNNFDGRWHLHLIYQVVWQTPWYYAYVLWVYDPPPSSLVNSDNPDKLWSSTLQTVNRWRPDEYSCFSHPSFLCSFHEHPFHGQTSGLTVRPDAARWKVVALLLVSEWWVSVWVLLYFASCISGQYYDRRKPVAGIMSSSYQII